MKKWVAWVHICFILYLLVTPIALANTTYIRGKLLHFLDNPDTSATQKSYQYFEDGILIIQDGKILKAGNWNQLKKEIPPKATITQYKNGLILPGFIDTHIHYPQLDMIAANSGGHLLEWLNKYTFPFEKKFSNQQYAHDVANFFLDELLRNGTTTAMIFATRYPVAIDELFDAAEKRNMRIITGKVMADRNLPPYLIESPEHAAQETISLINKWHEKPNSRLLYAVTFRFAPTTSENMFKEISQLKTKYPTVYIYTHISENQQETKWSNNLFHTTHYLEIYDKYQLLGERTLLAHGVYLSKNELMRMKETNTSVSFCPTSNLFLGSGLFNLTETEKRGVTIGLGTDVGAGTSFSLLQTLNEAYKVLQLQNQTLSPLEGFYLATLGGARSLHLDNQLGNFKPGKEADFIVLNMNGPTPLLKRRLSMASNLEDKLFVLMTLGDDRSILSTYVNGKLVYSQK